MLSENSYGYKMALCNNISCNASTPRTRIAVSPPKHCNCFGKMLSSEPTRREMRKPGQADLGVTSQIHVYHVMCCCLVG